MISKIKEDLKYTDKNVSTRDYLGNKYFSFLHKDDTISSSDVNSLVDSGMSVFRCKSLDCCPNADFFHRETLNRWSKCYRRGYVVVVEDMPIGHIKLEGTKSFLAWRNLGENNGILLGGIYAISRQLYGFVEKSSNLERGKWGFVHLNKFEGYPLRYLQEDSINCYLNRSSRNLIRRERKLVGKIMDKGEAYLTEFIC